VIDVDSHRGECGCRGGGVGITTVSVVDHTIRRYVVYYT